MNLALTHAGNQRVHTEEADETATSIEDLNAVIEFVRDEDAGRRTLAAHGDITWRVELPRTRSEFTNRDAVWVRHSIVGRGESPDAIVQSIGDEHRSIIECRDAARVTELSFAEARSLHALARAEDQCALSSIGDHDSLRVKCDARGLFEEVRAEHAPRSVSTDANDARCVGDSHRAIWRDIERDGCEGSAQ